MVLKGGLRSPFLPFNGGRLSGYNVRMNRTAYTALKTPDLPYTPETKQTAPCPEKRGYCANY